MIDCLLDLNPNKWNHHVAGTGHLIIPPGDLAERGVRTAILMNPNYREEIVRMLTEQQIELELIEWSDQE